MTICISTSDLFSGFVPQIITAIILLGGYVWQFRQFRKQMEITQEQTFKTNSVTLILNLQKYFDEELMKSRKIFSNQILTDDILKQDEISKEYYEEGRIRLIEDMIDFFDLLGFYIKHEYIKSNLVWENFYHWFIHYYMFYKKYNIKSFRFDNPAIWNKLDFLKLVLDKIEIEEGGTIEEISKRDLEKFFEDESNLF